jgi:FAD/FMN-containing dehydrogenase
VRGEILLRLARLRAVRAVDAVGHTLTVEAGLTLAESGKPPTAPVATFP